MVQKKGLSNMADELELLANMPSNEATDPDIPSQEPVAQMGDDKGDE